LNGFVTLMSDKGIGMLGNDAGESGTETTGALGCIEMTSDGLPASSRQLKVRLNSSQRSLSHSSSIAVKTGLRLLRARKGGVLWVSKGTSGAPLRP
jgi:hypothetical protein